MPDSVPAQLGRRAAMEVCGKPVAHGVYASERLSLGEVGKIAQDSHGRQPDSRNVTVRDDTGGRMETWAMEKAKRARKAETPKQPSLSLRLRAPYLYPDQSGPRARRRIAMHHSHAMSIEN
jgi:hypothetical protein